MDDMGRYHHDSCLHEFGEPNADSNHHRPRRAATESVEHLDSPTTVIRRSQAARTDHPIPAQPPSARVDRTNIPANTHLISDKTHISDNGDCYLTAKTIYIRFPHCNIPNILIEMLQKTSDFIKTLLFLYIGKNDKNPLFWIFAISVKNIGFHKNTYL
jgi:hypothetical protein